MNKLMIKFGGMISALALMITATNANITCSFTIHQPKLPLNAKQLRKF